MQNKISCLIFDFDGVIANTELGRFKTLNQVLAGYDFELSKSMSIKDIIGLSTKSFLKQNSKTLTDSQIDDIINQRHKLYFSNLTSFCLPYESMKETIEFFSKQFDLALVTTNSKNNVETLLEHLSIKGFFKWIIGREQSENDHLSKTYSQIPRLIGKAVSECIVIEDSDIGIDAAKAEGYFCIRYDSENLFKKGNEDLKVKNYCELKNTIMLYTSNNDNQ